MHGYFEEQASCTSHGISGQSDATLKRWERWSRDTTQPPHTHGVFGL